MDTQTILKNGQGTFFGQAILCILTILLFGGFTNTAYAKPQISLDQCANGAVGMPREQCIGSAWQNGNLNSNQSQYFEGNFVPYRAIITDPVNGHVYTVRIQWDATQGDDHAIDYIGSMDGTEVNPVPCDAGEPNCAIVDTHTIPLDPIVLLGAGGGNGDASDDIPPYPLGVMTLYGGDITNVEYSPGVPYLYIDPIDGVNDYTSTTTAETIVTFTYTGVTGDTAYLSWGGHISTRLDWGLENSAVDVSGSPYHMRVEGFTCFDPVNNQFDNTCGVGNQDRSLNADAVIFPGAITVVKDSNPDDEQDFVFSISSEGAAAFDLNGAELLPITLEDDGDNMDELMNAGTWELVGPGTYSISEAAVTDWFLDSVSCLIDNEDGSTSPIGTELDGVMTFTLPEGGNVTCTFVNSFDSRPDISLIKTAIRLLPDDIPITPNDPNTPIFGVEAGDQIEYTFDIQNVGNTDLFMVVLNDPDISPLPLDCPPEIEPLDADPDMAVPYDGEIVQCVANLTLTDEIINAGSFLNTAVVTGEDAGGTTVMDEDSESIYFAPTLTLIKSVINDNGGTAGPNDFGIMVDGNAVTSGDKIAYAAGVPLSIDEAGFGGYSFVDITGDAKCPAVLGGTVTLDYGDNVTCTITNDDISPTLTLIKTVVNDNGGTAAPDDFMLTVDGGAVLSGATNDFNAGDHLAAETNLPGYAAGTWGGDCAPDGSITLALDQDATCTITNDDISPTLTLIKTVVNDNGGTAAPDDFMLTVDGGAVLSGATNDFSAGDHLAAETNLPGYAAGTWGGDCAPDGSITLALDQDATCTITNDDISPTLTLIKTVVNDNGGTAAPDDFMLTVDGGAVLSGATNDFSAGDHLAAETNLPGYAAGTWGGDCAPDGSITLALDQDATCTITNDDISPTLTLIKTVVNDNGGTAAPDDFMLTVDGGAVLSGATNDFSAGDHLAAETNLPGYAAGTWGGDCAPDGSITLALDQDATCTITNDDISPTLTLIKTVVNDNGGTAAPDDFMLTVDGGAVLSGATNDFNAGDHLAAETNLPGYAAGTWGGDCAPDGSITLALDQDATCTITNDDISPTLTLIKTVVNDNGGTAAPDDFMLTVDGGAVLSGATNDFNAGDHLAAETNLPGYAAGTWGGDCAPDGSITLALDQDATCTITNDDISPTLTLIKTVVNDNGGTAAPDDFMLTVDGGAVLSGATNDFSAGDHLAAETNLPGYAAGTWGGDCAPDGSITLALDQDATCTITNDDISPTLTLIKTVVNDNGGTAAPDDFMLTVDGGAVLSGATNDFNAGDHLAAETNLPGYAAGTWGGDCAPDGSITLALDQDATCTITNDDISPTLTLIKTVVNDNGGTAAPDDFMLTVDGGAVLSGATNDFSAGDHLAAETNLPGYAAGTWGGDCAPDGSITLALDQDATCTITNDDISPTLTLIKTVVNDNGGTAAPDDFMLTVDGGAVLSGATNDFSAGDHLAAETNLPGYAAGTWGGDCAPDGSITLALDQDATCTITNDDISPTLTLIKTVVNDNGGTAAPDDFMLTVDGGAVLSGATNDFSAGDHLAAETNLPGYAAGTWGGDCAPDGSITLALDQDATCTITNDDISPTLTLIKTVVNDNGGTAAPDDFMLTVDGGAVLSGATNDFSAGDHLAAETNLPGYAAGTWGGDCAPDGSITLALDQDATCTITNDDISPTLTLIKTVVNDNGGTAAPDDFMLTVDGGAVLSGATNDFSAGDHLAAETNLPGYAAGTWGGDCAPDGSITLALDQDATCTITNDDISPTLTLIKTVVNDNGGTAAPDDFMLTVDGGAVLSGATNDFNAGDHLAAETNLPGYAAGTWGGDCAPDGSITLALDQDATCTITNDDIAPKLTLIKVVDNGLSQVGTSVATDWTLTATGPTGFSGTTGVMSDASFDQGSYALSESGPVGYLDSTWSCVGNSDDGSDGVVDIGLADDVTCTITNTSMSKVKVAKTVNGLPLMIGDKSFTFELRQGATPGLTGSPGTILETQIATGDNMGMITFATYLVPGETYQMCETDQENGWMNIFGDGLTQFVPAGGVGTNTDNSTECINFTAGIGELVQIDVNNIPPPGGDARTIGYWKNWTSCDGHGNQEAKLDEKLSYGPVVLGTDEYIIDSCEVAVDLLDKRKVADPAVVGDGQKSASDPIYNMVAQLVAAKLNIAPPDAAGSCQALVDAIAAADALIDEVGFDGNIMYVTKGRKKGTTLITDDQAALANVLGGTLDEYNNNELCN